MSIMELTLATCEAAAHAQRLLLNIAWLPSSALANHFTTPPKQQKAADGEFKASHQSNCDWTENNQTLTSALITSGLWVKPFTPMNYIYCTTNTLLAPVHASFPLQAMSLFMPHGHGAQAGNLDSVDVANILSLEEGQVCTTTTAVQHTSTWRWLHGHQWWWKLLHCVRGILMDPPHEKTFSTRLKVMQGLATGQGGPCLFSLDSVWLVQQVLSSIKTSDLLDGGAKETGGLLSQCCYSNVCVCGKSQRVAVRPTHPTGSQNFIRCGDPRKNLICKSKVGVGHLPHLYFARIWCMGKVLLLHHVHTISTKSRPPIQSSII